MTDMRPDARYLEIADELRKDIEANVYPIGERLPGTPQIAADYGVSPGIARMALHVLCREGIIYPRSTVGHFISPREGQTPVRTDHLNQQIADELRDKITSGAYEPAQKLPSLRQLAAQHHSSTAPVRQAIEQLTTEGLVVNVPHDGAYVAVPKDSI